MLHREVDAEGEDGRVVLVHGFTQTLRSWDTVAARLAARRPVVRVDLPGHGGSSGERAGFADAAAAIGDAGGRAAYVGYSLGGRLCLRLALDRPDLVAALVLVGASPGLADPLERERRRRADEDLAASIETGGTDSFLERWLASPLFAALTLSDTDLRSRRSNAPEGLAAALRLLGTGTQEPLWDRLDELAMPVLLVAGGDDPKFADVARRTALAVAATVAVVEGAGHAVHLERPEQFVALLDDFLDRVHPGA